MKKKIITLALLAMSATTFAQKSFEFGYGIGSSNYLGDLQPKAYTWENPGFATGFFVKTNLNAWFGFKGFLNYGRLHASDANSIEQGRLQRNLSFRSYVLEFGGQAEVNVLPFDAYNPQNKSYRRYFNWTPYFFGGLNVFHFNPKTFYNNSWVELQPLGTEGQGTSFNTKRPYNRTQVAIPFGFGMRWAINKHIMVGAEVGVRKTFTDYIDDVSTNYVNLSDLAAENGQLAAELSWRGDEVSNGSGYTPIVGEARGRSENMDWYTMNTVTFSYRIIPKKRAFRQW
ncbi:MAG: outer membrane beta-barrel protein [Chitinophagaceae bacterium]|nr:outer membrane beta-barrel protein [Chitinophagaceae bacterium]